MSACATCTCTTVPAAPAGERLLLATSVAHTVGALRALAARCGTQVRARGPGLLELAGPLPALLAAAGAELSDRKSVV